jgi:hypothetical protein
VEVINVRAAVERAESCLRGVVGAGLGTCASAGLAHDRLLHACNKRRAEARWLHTSVLVVIVDDVVFLNDAD